MQSSLISGVAGDGKREGVLGLRRAAQRIQRRPTDAIEARGLIWLCQPGIQLLNRLFQLAAINQGLRLREPRIAVSGSEPMCSGRHPEWYSQG